MATAICQRSVPFCERIRVILERQLEIRSEKLKAVKSKISRKRTKKAPISSLQ